MVRSRRAWHLLLAAGLVALAASLVWSLTTTTDAQAQLRSPVGSDPRATFVEGNVTTCAAAGFASSVQMGSPTNTDAADVNVSGTVATNAGTVQPGQGQEVNVTIVGAGVVIDAIIVKGGPAYNRYTDPTFLPPTLGTPQHYISPFNGGGNVPTISHWFVCYHLTTPPPVGSLTVQKQVIAPNGIPIEPPPSEVAVLVNCDDGNPAHEDVLMTFGLGGGRASNGSTLTDIPPGTVCTVVEQGTNNSVLFPPGTVVSYDPTGADDPGVTIEADAAAVVTVVNDYSGIAVQPATVVVNKSVVAAPDVDVPETFTAHVSCDDGTEQDVTLPGTGGAGTPAVVMKAGSLCFVEESTTSLPTGWVVTYSVDGGPASATPPIVGPIASNATVAVTITNDPTNATTTTTTTVAPTSTTTAENTTTTTGASTVVGAENLGTGSGSGSGDLPFTGANGIGALIAGLASLVAGIALLAEAWRRRAWQAN